MYICMRTLFAQLLPSVAPKCVHTRICQTELKIIRARKYETATYSNCTIWNLNLNRPGSRKEIPNIKWSQNVPDGSTRPLQKIWIKL